MNSCFKLQTITYIVNLREKFSPGPGFEAESPVLRALTLTNWATQTIESWPRREFVSYMNNTGSARALFWKTKFPLITFNYF